MFKLVVLSALVAVTLAAPKPGFLAAAPAAFAVPTAVSHQYRTDVISRPYYTTYAAAPVVAATAYAAPAVAYPAAVSHQSRVDVIRPVATTVYASPAYAHYGYAATHGW